MTLPKWTDERTAELMNAVGSENPVTQETVTRVAEALGTTARSVASKLRKLDVAVESVAERATLKYTPEEEAEISNFLTGNSGQFTYAELAERFDRSAKSIQGKILSMELTSHVRPTPKVEAVRTYTADEEATFTQMAQSGASIEAIAERLGKEVNSVRGKALSLLRAGAIESIPHQANKAPAKEDAFENLGDVSGMTVQQIADALNKTVRGVKTMLTRRRVKVADYDGASKAVKAAA